MVLKPVSQKEILKKRYKPFVLDKRLVIVGLLALLLSFFFDIKRFIFVAIFIVLNCILLSLDRYMNLPVDLEFSTFSAILFTITYGLKWGIFVGVITKVAAMVYNANIRADHFFMIVGYCMAAFIASVLNVVHMNVVMMGLISAILVNIYIYFVSKYITNLYDFEILMYGSSNIIFNMVLFVGFSEPILTLMRM